QLGGDNRLPLVPSELVAYTRALALNVLDRTKYSSLIQALNGSAATGGPPEWKKAVAEDLTSHKGECLVVAGPRQPPVVHALACLLNSALGNIGKSVVYHPKAETGYRPLKE